MSDKSQMLMLEAAAVSANTFTFSKETNTLGHQELKELMFSQLVLPDLERLVKAHAKEGSVDIKGYDDGSKIFQGTPALNELTLEEGGETIIAAIRTNNYTLEEVLKKYKEPLIKLMYESFEENVKTKKNEWEKGGFISKKEGSEFYTNFRLDANYIEEKAKEVPEEVLKEGQDAESYAVDMAVNEYVLNNMLGLANMYMMFSGDLALYSKKAKDYFNVDENKVVNMASPRYTGAYQDYVKQTTSLALNKRLAALIAPGYKLANSVNNLGISETYTQILLKDPVDISSNLPFLADTHYGDVAAKKTKIEELESMVTTYNANKTKDAYEEIVNFTEQNFPAIADFTALEGADAQEYTTSYEHLENLFGLGRTTLEQHTELLGKIKMQKEAEKRGEPFPREAFLSSTEKKIYFQPLKPVHTGFYNDKSNDVMRMVYIKSSSFPLLPEMTLGQPLDELRRFLEDIETTFNDAGKVVHSKPVRASYQSGNKVGSVNKGLDVWDRNGNFQKEFLNTNPELVKHNTLELDRDNYRIQQDIPQKSSKKLEDLISEGTQNTKLLFGNDVLTLTKIPYKGETKSGMDLFDMYQNRYIKFVQNKKKDLYERFGFKDGEIFNIKKAAETVQELLLDEAEGKSFSAQDKEALKLVVDFNLSLNLGGDKGSLILGSNLTLKQSDIDTLLKFNNVLQTNNTEEIENFKNAKPYKKLKEALSNSNKESVLQDLEDNSTTDAKLVPEYTDFEFNSPIWLSPNANKYESLLNAIVTNALSKNKMPGYSYIAGSEYGFKSPNFEIKEEDDKEVQKHASRIIYTSNYTKEGTSRELQGATDKNKTQVMLNPKLRDANGVLIDLWEEIDGEYTYLKNDVKGKLQLDETKIDMSLLDLSTFRIPTSGHVSMSQIEVVGILPPEAADLMVVAKNITAQKGLDFDIDKENLYKRWTLIDKKGVVVPLTEKNRDEYESQVASGPKKLSARQVTNRVLQNEMLEIQSAVLSNPARGMQKKIQKVLSMDVAKGQSAMFEKASTKEDKSNTWFNMYSDSYQKDLLNINKSGKLGIGVYSNYVVLNSLANMSLYKEKPLRIKQQVEVKGVTESRDVSITLGNMVSDGVLGKTKTLEGAFSDIDNDIISFIKRTTTDVLEERQNTATDNANEQIMGALNINSTTINVDSLLSALGFDLDIFLISEAEATDNSKGVVMKQPNGVVSNYQEDVKDAKYYRVVNIPYALSTQPILKAYVKILEEKKNKFSEDRFKAEEAAVEEVLSKFATGSIDGEYTQEAYNEEKQNVGDPGEIMTGRNLYLETIKDTKLNQRKILFKFLEIDKQAKKVAKMQGLVSVGKEGLGQDFSTALDKYENLSTFMQDFVGSTQGNMVSIENSDALIGDFKTIDPEDSDYVKVKDVWIKPDTMLGVMLVNTLKAGHELFSDFVPYNNKDIQRMLNNIISQTGNENADTYKKTELKKAAFKAFKTYLYSSDALPLHNIKAGAYSASQLGMARLTLNKISGKKNESLGKYINALLKSPSVNSTIKNNPILSKLRITNPDAETTLIDFNAAKGVDFDENVYYNALLELADKAVMLPPKNGKAYDTVDLVKDLISYSFIDNGGIQEANQFIKYVPISLLEKLGFSDTVRNWNKAAARGAFGNMIKFDEAGNGASTFTQQFIRNNPEYAVKLKKKDYTINEEGKVILGIDTDKTVVSIKEGDKTILIRRENSDDNKTYVPVSNLSKNRLPEYYLSSNIESENFTSIYKGNKTPALKKSKKKKGKKSTTANIKGFANGLGLVSDKGEIAENVSAADVLDKISNFQFKEGEVKPLKNIVEAIKNNLEPNFEIRLRGEKDKAFKTDLSGDVRGSYKIGEDFITVNKDYFAGKESSLEIAEVIAHEMIHSLAEGFMRTYFMADGSIKKGSNPPAEVLELSDAYQRTKALTKQASRNGQIISEEDIKILREANKKLEEDESIEEFDAILKSVKDKYPKMSGKDFDKLYLFSTKTYYALSSPSEFMTHFLTDADLMENFSSADLGNDNGYTESSLKGLLKKLYDLILKSLGLNNQAAVNYAVSLEALRSFDTLDENLKTVEESSFTEPDENLEEGAGQGSLFSLAFESDNIDLESKQDMSIFERIYNLCK